MTPEKPRSEKRRLTHALNVRLSPAQHDELQRIGDELGVGLGGAIRALVRREMRARIAREIDAQTEGALDQADLEANVSRVLASVDPAGDES